MFGQKVAAYLCLIVPLRGTAARAGNHYFSKGNQEHAWIAHAVCGQALAFVAYEGSPEHVFALPCLRLVQPTKPLVFEACKPFGAQQRHQMRIQHGRFLVAMAAALSSALLHSPPLVIGIQCPDFARKWRLVRQHCCPSTHGGSGQTVAPGQNLLLGGWDREPPLVGNCKFRVTAQRPANFGSNAVAQPFAPRLMLTAKPSRRAQRTVSLPTTHLSSSTPPTVHTCSRHPSVFHGVVSSCIVLWRCDVATKAGAPKKLVASHFSTCHSPPHAHTAAAT